jgi:hypothetical protein
MHIIRILRLKKYVAVACLILLSTALSACSQANPSGTTADSPSPVQSSAEPNIEEEPAWKKYLELEVLELTISTTDCNPEGSMDYILRITNLTNIRIVHVEGGATQSAKASESGLIGVDINDGLSVEGGETFLQKPGGCLEFKKVFNQAAYDSFEFDQKLDFEYDVSKIYFEDGQILDFISWDDPIFLP